MTERPLVLLTGASGFVGRHLAAALLASGHAVRAPLRRPVAGLPAGVEQAPMGDLAQPQDWTGLLRGVDAVVHGAGIAHAGPEIPASSYDRVNRDAALELGQAAAGRVRRFVFLSSIRAQTGPSSPGLLREDDPPAPTDAYGRAKLAAEEGLARLDLGAVSLRPVVVYGAGVGGNVGQLLRLARLPVPLPFGGLTAPRSFLSVENLAAAVQLALAETALPPGPLVVADPQPSSLAELVRAMRAALGRPALLPVVPERLVRGMLAAVGAAGLAERLAGGLAADPARLVRLGWQPPARTTPEGVGRWLTAR